MTKLWLAWISVQLAFGYHPVIAIQHYDDGKIAEMTIIARNGGVLTIGSSVRIDCSKMKECFAEDWVYRQDIDVDAFYKSPEPSPR